MNRTTFLAVLCLTPLFASFGCSDSATGDGEEQTSESSATLSKGWTRSVSNDAGNGIRYALGSTVRIQVSDRATGPTTCTDAQSSGCNGPTCSTPVDETNSSIVSLVCDGGCDATATRTGPGSFTIDVTPTTAGTSNITIALVDDKGVVLTTKARIDTAQPTAISLTREVESPNGTAYAVTPGAVFSWCASLTDSAGPLAYFDDLLTFSITGAEFDPPSYDISSAIPRYATCFSFSAAERGDILFHATSKTVERRETIHVVDPSEVVRAEVVAEIAPDFSNVEVPIEQDPLATFNDATRGVVIDSCSMHPTRLALRGFTAAGQAVLAPVSCLTISPDDLVSDDRRDSALAAQLVDVTPLRRGAGAIVAAIGDASLTIPLTVAGRCAPAPEAPDGGSDDAGDAGADADPDAGP